MKKYIFFIALFVSVFLFNSYALAGKSCCIEQSCKCGKNVCCTDGKCACKGDCCAKDNCKCAEGNCSKKCNC